MAEPRVSDKTALLERLLKERILILDGAMGTMIQGYRLGEDDYRGPPACERASAEPPSRSAFGRQKRR